MDDIGDSKVTMESSTPSNSFSQRRVKASIDKPARRALGFENEKFLVADLQRLQKHGFVLYKKMVRRIAYRYARELGIENRINHENRMASEPWLRCFKTRNPTLRLRQGIQLNINDETIDKIFNNFLNEESSNQSKYLTPKSKYISNPHGAITNANTKDVPSLHATEVENEKYLVTDLQRLETHGFVLHNQLVRRIAFRYASALGIDSHRISYRNGMASVTWLRSFKRRHPTLKVAQGIQLNIQDETIDRIFRDFLNDESFKSNLSKISQPQLEDNSNSDGVKTDENAKQQNQSFMEQLNENKHPTVKDDEPMASTLPLLPDIEGTIMKLKQEEVQIDSACAEEITIEENKIEIRVHTEQTDEGSNDNRRKEITEDDVEAYICEVMDTNSIKIPDGAQALANSKKRRGNVKIIRTKVDDNYNIFATFLAPKLRSVRSAEDQIKMMKNIMDFFQCNK